LNLSTPHAGSGTIPTARYHVAAAPSKLHGRGLFARGALPARRKIGELSGSLVKLPDAWHTAAGQPRIYLVQVSARRALDCSQGNDFKYLNHSCAPNCYLRVHRLRVEVYTLRRIKPGTELTVDYGETPHRDGMRCTCGAENCRGVV
jgi:SET domain-containing protein